MQHYVRIIKVKLVFPQFPFWPVLRAHLGCCSDWIPIHGSERPSACSQTWSLIWSFKPSFSGFYLQSYNQLHSLLVNVFFIDASKQHLVGRWSWGATSRLFNSDSNETYDNGTWQNLLLTTIAKNVAVETDIIPKHVGEPLIQPSVNPWILVHRFTQRFLDLLMLWLWTHQACHYWV